MGFLQSLGRLASDAWHFLTGLGGDIGNALAAVWRFAASIAALLDHLISAVLRGTIGGLLTWNFYLLGAIEKLVGAVERIGDWIWFHFIAPVKTWVRGLVAALKAWTVRQLAAQRAEYWGLYHRALAYAAKLVAAERAARIADVQAARRYALALVVALHAAIESEAATGYNSGRRARAGVAGKILDDLAVRNPVIRALTGRLITLILDLAAVDNPVARVVVGVLLRQLINRLGVDRVAGNLLARILGSLTGHGEPKSLHDVTRDIDERLTGLEDQWAEFMTDGGPEVMQAGKEWKAETGVLADLAMLGFFALAVHNPAGWARDVSATAGTAVNDTIIGVTHLIRRG